jgi:hypothetical protein
MRIKINVIKCQVKGKKYFLKLTYNKDAVSHAAAKCPTWSITFT